jgi:hypothetical protein
LRPATIFVLFSAAQGGYNCLCSEERCSVTL